MFILLALLLVLLIVPLVATRLFMRWVAHRIASDILRIASIGSCYLLVLVGFSWGSLLLSAVFALSDLYPTTTHPLDDPYYFTQQAYGFATMMSNGYNLTFYRQRPFWLDEELGRVQLECSGRETIRATVQPAGTGRLRLRLAADAQQRLDTVFDLGAPFNFRRTFEDRTLDFSRGR